MTRRSAFTLVEMLVAVALVMVMMVLFAAIFQLATGSMATQKGIAENDQRVRLVQMILKNDMACSPTEKVTGTQIQSHRTFRWLVPWAAGETALHPSGWGADAVADRQGYFTISEGDPNDDADDNLQFTVTIPSSADGRIFGRAAILLATPAGAYGPAGTTPPPAPYPPPAPTSPPLVPPPAAGYYWPNQPEFDDLLGTPNQVGSSTTAEVAYFLRSGTLYRRVMLVRLPNVATPPDDYAPHDDAGAQLAVTPYSNGTRNFWTDFDYSAFFDNASAQVVFHGLSDLTAANVTSTLMNPANRWGFDNTTNFPNGGGGYGLPREYVSGNYIGRFTHSETSDAAFGYPARVTAGTPNPMANSTALTFANGQVTSFPNGTRTGEDVLLTNVLSFDIKVWDPAASLGPDGAPGIAGFDDDGINGIDDYGELGAFGSDDGDWKDVGHAGFTPPNPAPFTKPPLPQYQPPYGFYCRARCQNVYYSNAGATPPVNRYDTWGPSVEIDGDLTNTVPDTPPYRPIYAGPDGRPGNVGDDSGPAGEDAGELGLAGSDDFAPLTAIKITIRFYDVTSNQVRDISAVYSLVFAP